MTDYSGIRRISTTVKVSRIEIGEKVHSEKACVGATQVCYREDPQPPLQATPLCGLVLGHDLVMCCVLKCKARWATRAPVSFAQPVTDTTDPPDAQPPAFDFEAATQHVLVNAYSNAVYMQQNINIAVQAAFVMGVNILYTTVGAALDKAYGTKSKSE